MADTSLRFLGTFEVLRDGAPITHFRGDKVRALLVYLAVEHDRPHARATLAALLWPEHGDGLALRNLAQAVARLRTALGDSGALLASTRHALQWRGADGAVDVSAFRRLVGSAEWADLAHGTELYRGEFLAGFGVPDCEAFDEWLLLTREQLQQQALAALGTLVEQHLAGGRWALAAQAARRQLELDPWREDAQRQLMLALVGGGDRAAALAAYDACCRTLRDTLQVEPDIETRLLAERIRTGDGTSGAVREPVPAHRLPAQLTPFVGRERELAELVALVRQDDVRLVTLVGAGGMGKTRLALEVARGLLATPADGDHAGSPGAIRYPDGGCFVSLAPLTAAAALVSTIATALGLPLHGGDPTDVLLGYLRPKRLLLVLDNVEHLLEPGAGQDNAVVELVLEIMRTAPGVQLLATSRERLNVSGEQIYVVQGLDYAAEDAATSSAVRLFAQRARRALPGFELSQSNAPLIMRICELVQGMPLGLELAAAWVELVALDTIAAEIERSADFLSFDWRDLPARQRSMRAVFDWSWQLLTDAERQAVRGLSVFHGGCTRQAAQAVADAPLRVLASLTHKSMLRWVWTHDGAGRYEMHELLRQFAAEQLAAVPDEAEAAAARHSRYYLAFVAARDARLAHDAPRDAALEIRAQLDNIRAAWAWAAANRRRDELDRSAYGLWQFYVLTGLLAEGAQAFAAAAAPLVEAANAAAPATHAAASVQRSAAKLLALQAHFITHPSTYAQAISNAHAAIALGHASGGVEGEVIGACTLGKALFQSGQSTDALAQFEQALHTARRYQHSHPTLDVVAAMEWYALLYLQAINQRLGHFSLGRSYGTQALELCRRQNRRFGEVSCLSNRADIARAMRDLPMARTDTEHALRLAPLVGAPWSEAALRFELGEVVSLQGAYGVALQHFEHARTMFGELGDVIEGARTAAYLGRLYSFLGAYARADEWLGQFADSTATIESHDVLVEGWIARALHHLNTGAASHAVADAEQAHRLAVELQDVPAQADALTVRAHAQAALDDRGAAATYGEALAHYRTLGIPALAAEPRAGLAALALADGDLAVALAHVDELLEVLAAEPSVGLNEPFGIWLTCVRVLDAAGDARAAPVLEAARARLHAYGEQIDDPVLRRSFMEQVPVHRTLAQAYVQRRGAVAAPARGAAAPSTIA